MLAKEHPTNWFSPGVGVLGLGCVSVIGNLEVGMVGGKERKGLSTRRSKDAKLLMDEYR